MQNTVITIARGYGSEAQKLPIVEMDAQILRQHLADGFSAAAVEMCIRDR